MKRVKKNTNNKKMVPILIILATLLVISAALLVYIYTQNYITVEYVDKASNNVKSDEVTSVSPIVINNVLVGGVSDKGKWLSKDNLFGKANISKGTEVDMYGQKGKIGTFEIYSVSRNDEKGITYAIPLKDLADEEYVAISKSEDNVMIRGLTKLEVSDEDKKYVKKALGKYRLFNNTVKVNEVYETYLNSDQKTRIISATSSGKNNFGVYSVVVYVEGNNARIMKYSYVKNTESSINWPVYSIKFACDLNKDGSYEVILQEARELTMKYSIMERRGNKYYEVIGYSFNIK